MTVMPLSGDPPRSKVLAVVLVVIALGLALAPFLFPGAKPLNVAAKICIFIALAASYDLLLGYTGVVSFAHTMFYGIGSYGIAIALYGLGARWDAVGLGLIVALPLAALLALVIGLFSLRVQTIFFAMITLAVASAFAVLASQLSWLTGGEDGRSFRVPDLLQPGTVFIPRDVLGVAVTGRTLTYYLVFVCCVLLFLLLLRVVNSPFGRVLQAIRENPFRAEALGYQTVMHRILANCIAAAVAAAVVVIGGMGTLYGAVIGGTLYILAQNYLQTLMGSVSTAAADAGIPILPQLFHPDRWLLWLGILFILSVYFFPTGIVGKLRGSS